MYKILVVDDEPMVSTGIRNFLLSSDLQISHVETALNGFEAIDCLRMESYDLVLTDIQMGSMNGLELMEIICLEQPALSIIVISAHEKFDFAKKSLQLGAKDYLVKPVKRPELLRIVGKVLQEKEEKGKNSLELSAKERESDKSSVSNRNDLLIELMSERSLNPLQVDALREALGVSNGTPFFAVASMRLDLNRGGFSNQEIRIQDRKLLKYAIINIVEESLKEWNGMVFDGLGNELIAIVMLNNQVESDEGQRPGQTMLQMIGQFISLNVKQYLNIETTVGMSTLNSEIIMLPKLMEEAKSAAEWRKLLPGQKIFYYDDMIDQENVHIVEWMASVDEYIQLLKSCSSEEEFVDSSRVIQALKELGQSPDMMSSYLGILVYRIYGLMLEYSKGLGGMSLHRYYPDHYFRGLSTQERIDQLQAYTDEASKTIQIMSKERNLTILERIMGYIRSNYRNPSLKLQDIASAVNYSTTYLSHLFKREYNTHIWDFVTEMRIEEAKLLLVSSDKKRYEIAYLVGYESPEHFSRMFKRYVNLSPAEYRKEYQGGSD
jgi:two-component system, response regulator YesN